MYKNILHFLIFFKKKSIFYRVDTLYIHTRYYKKGESSMTQLTISYGNQKTTYNVNLKDSSKILKYCDLSAGNGQKVLFNFSAKEYKAESASFYQKLCTVLNNLMALGGDKNAIDDGDFKTAQETKSKPVNGGTCCDTKNQNLNKWHFDEQEGDAIMYHTANGGNFFIEV